MRKFYSFILFMIIILILSGCGSKTQDPTPTPTPTPTPSEETAEELFSKGLAITQMSFDIVIESEGQQIEGKMFIKDQNMRMEMEADGQLLITIVNSTDKTAYVYMPSQNMAYKVPMDTVDTDEQSAPTDFITDIDPEIVEMGEIVTLNGVQCRKMTIHQEPELTMWIHLEYGIPIRVEMALNETSFSMEYRNIQINNISDDLFKLPNGVTISG